MAITQQQYADLASSSYEEHKKYTVNNEYNIGGTNYKILAHSSDKNTDYQGTIYQRVDTGEIIVAHRGTEPNKKGDVAADYEMASKFTNPQIPHALKLTELAFKFAKDHEKEFGNAPEISVTGHSLGGALAQVSAFEYGLKAETFNAYGAAGLKYTDLYGNKETVPLQNNGKVTNHIMAGDVVGAANNHFGKNVIYAREKEIEVLKAHKYGDGKPGNNQMWRAAKELMSKHNAHNMPNFTNEKGPSILSDPKAKELAQKEASIIHEYRSDIKANRGPILKKVNTADKVSDAIFPSKMILKKILSDNTDHSQEKSTLYAQREGKGDLNDIMNNDVKGIYAKLESSLGPQLADKGAGKWAEPMIAATTYACVQKGLSADKIAHIGINEKENVLYAVSANRRDFATVNAIEASKVNPEQTLLAANQLHDQMGMETQQKELDRQMQMNQQQHGGMKFA
ncbi:lipase family protein [Neisseria sp. Ec49-e6-T10]|uniref:lipase family protein n=1 Tax=Neisseria sp. Ec49-e6-T10 TaxID=3140744 RepID=UPI003EB92433